MLEKKASETGQGITEFGLILSLIVVVVIIVLGLLGPQIAVWYQYIVDSI